MKIFQCRLGIIAAAVLSLFSNCLHAQVNVTTYHNDVARTGQNTLEVTLTPANVNATTFGKLFSVAVDGWVYAQPLYLSNVTIDGGTHNVVYVATEHDSLYAIDADNGTIYWQLSLIPAGGSTVTSAANLDCGDLVPEVGITGTPVIDPSSGTIYLVAKSKVGGNIVQYLHAIDVVTATEKFGAPIAIQASVPGSASDAVGGLVTFSPQHENQRAALLLDTDRQGISHVIIGWAAHCDISPWHGWLMSYNAATLAQEAVFNGSPNGYANGIWMSGAGPAADSSGNVYVATGNGSWNGTTDFGDSIVKLGPPSGGSFPVLDYFTPYDQATLSTDDLDVSSGGLIVLPTATNGKQQIVLQAKVGTIFNLDSSNLGKYCINQTPACTNSDPQISQEILHASVGIWGAPAYWNGSVYWAGGNDNTQAKDSIKAFGVNPANGLLSTTPTSQTVQTFGFSAPVPVVSSNGTTNGILWGLDDSEFGTCTVKTHCQVCMPMMRPTRQPSLQQPASRLFPRRARGGRQVRDADRRQRQGICRQSIPARGLRPSDRNADRDAGVQPGRGLLHRRTVRDHHGRHHGLDDLLHDQRHHADDRLHALQRADRGGRHDDDQCDCRRHRLHQQRGRHGHLHDHRPAGHRDAGRRYPAVAHGVCHRQSRHGGHWRRSRWPRATLTIRAS